MSVAVSGGVIPVADGRMGTVAGDGADGARVVSGGVIPVADGRMGTVAGDGVDGTSVVDGGRLLPGGAAGRGAGSGGTGGSGGNGRTESPGLTGMGATGTPPRRMLLAAESTHAFMSSRFSRAIESRRATTVLSAAAAAAGETGGGGAVRPLANCADAVAGTAASTMSAPSRPAIPRLMDLAVMEERP